MQCTHFDDLEPVKLSSTRGCEECLKIGGYWVHLRECLVCGNVGCCDSSPNKHATKHNHATKHPVIRSIEPGETWGYCYADDVMVDLGRRGMKIDHVQEPLEVSDARMQGSSFVRVNLADASFSDVNLRNVSVDNVNLEGSRWNNVNLSRLKITDANLSHASISESCTHGMTIDGIAVEDLMAAYRAAQGKA